MTLQSRTFVMSFSPSCRDCSTPAKLSRSIVPRMIDTAGRDFSQGMISSPPTGRFFLNLLPALKSLHLQLLRVFHC